MAATEVRCRPLNVGRSGGGTRFGNPCTMTTSEKKKLVTSNTLLWLMAMVLPGALHLALGSTRFPWQVVVPLLLLGAMLASNSMLTKAIGKTTDDSNPT